MTRGRDPSPLLHRLVRYARIEASGCWIWTGYRNPVSGYGQVSPSKPDRERLRLHRTSTVPTAMCALINGPAPVGHEVLHSCDVRACFAPYHLRWGTRAENNAEAWERGRQVFGERHGQAHFSDEDVALLRERVAAGEGLTEVALEMGFSVSHACNIVKGRWRVREQEARVR